jgi:hypothetical protein
MKKLYIERKDRVIKIDKRFNHVMALTLNPKTGYKDGVIRCITSRTGPEGFMGQIDRSVLHKVVGTSLTKFKIVEELKIKNKEKIIKELVGTDFDFLGLEDPDIWIDEKTNLLHLYFTLPLIGKKKTEIHIGHAVGKDLDNLVMTAPVLLADKKGGAKELSVVPVNKKGIRYNLVESSEKIGGTYYSTVRVAVTEDMSKSWKFGKTVFNPAKHSLKWIAGHASPGPLFPTSFIDVGDGKRVGIINGCVANKKVGKNIKYGTFSVGLFIYDYEKGVIDWVSPKPFIQDSEVGKIRAITFASQFVETKKGKGILYAHVDDSFVRAYELDAKLVLELLPKK